MKTVLSQFCQDFDERVRPLIEPLDLFSSQLGRLNEEAPLRALLPELLDLRHQVGTLVEKVSGQQAYVIIFGPLKSGKSTLMNALAAAYVSEVTTLPAYPCMVYVAHSPDPSLKITYYDGKTSLCPDLDSMRMLMSRAHVELASAIRSVDEHGEDFDPGLHLPNALRRVDVRMSAPPLAESGAVLVDTPGLYSRMKFGYDLMTREFRDSAASAIFVVKTDNLFLEQVFDEFSDLLRLFSRIFLIVNLDGTKQDLQPDGALGPSLERRDPGQIIDAFENLAMNAELKRAWEEGRLQIYPIDLLQAASRRLRGEWASPAETANGASDADLDEIESGAVNTDLFGDGERGDSFLRFDADLTHYLNSTEYLTAFLADSLRQARWLLAELNRLCDSRPVAELGRSLERWGVERDRASGVREAARRLKDYPWEQTLARLREDVVRITRERTTELRRKTAEEAEAALARWYDGDASYASFLQEELGPVFAKCRDEIIERAADVARTVLASDMAEAMVRRDASDDLSRVGLSVRAIEREVEGEVRSAAENRIVVPEIPPRVITIRRGLIDWLLLRGQTAVRRAVLGPDDAPTRPIPRAVKQRRLGAGRMALGEAIRIRLDLFFTESLARVAGEVFGAHVAAVCRQVHVRLESLATENTARLKNADETITQLSALRGGLEDLVASLSIASRSVADLGEAYGEPAPEATPEASEVLTEAQSQASADVDLAAAPPEATPSEPEEAPTTRDD